MPLKLPLFLFLLLGPCLAFAELKIPREMNSSARQEALQILGLGSSAKILGDPYPLGGYAGVEVGVAVESINTEELSRLGAKTPVKDSVSYSVLTFGKGLYHNVDLFLQMAPMAQGENISNFGGQLRWGFFEGKFVPAYMSFVASANSVSFQNLINVSTVAYDLVAGFAVNEVSFYTGVGYARSSGIFVGGANGVNEVTIPGQSPPTVNEDVNSSHYLLGLRFNLGQAFLALQMDRYMQSVYSAKLGFRF